MRVRPSILIVEHNRGHSALIEEKFRTAFPKAKIHQSCTLADAHSMIREATWDVVVINSQLPDGRGTDFLDPLSVEQPFAAVVVLSEDPLEEMDSDIKQRGVVEFLTKDRQTLDSFALRIKRLMETSGSISRMLRRGRASSSQAAFRDPLTQVYSRDYFDESLRREVSRANRYRQNMCILIVDVDNMKSINRAKGRTTGDRCLKRLAHSLVRAVRAGDIVARYANDRFVLLLPQCRRSDGIRCASRILSRLNRQPAAGYFTASIGVVHYQGVTKIVRPEKIVTAATQAALQAKVKGGNRYLIAI